MKTVRTTCPYCGVGCGVSAKITGARRVQIKGDFAHPANQGKLCSKGTHLGETVGLEGRLLTPHVDGADTDWDTALDAVAIRMQATIAEHGPDSVAFYVSGQLLTEDYYVVNKLAKGFVGTGNIDTNSRLCMASAVAAHNRAFGEDVVPCSYADLDAADLILLVGSNTAWCHPVMWQRIERARERRGTKLVVIDPRRTETAELADLHIPIAPDGDVALFTALLGELAVRDALDIEYMAQHVEIDPGALSKPDPAAHGIDPALFAQLADLVAAHPRMITLFSQGANQSVSGTDKGNAIINLHLATARIGRLGAGPFSITGQPNAMGGREVGGLANTLACHLSFSDDERAAVAGFWQTERLCGGPGLKAVDMFRAVHDGRIKFLWVMATNPAVSMPDAGFVREALARCPTVVVSDCMADTDTGKYAHIALPAQGWAEKDGTVTNSERRVSRQRALFPPAGEARPDWQIVCDVATRMGHGDAFAFASPAQVFAEYAAMTALAAERGKVLDLTKWTGCTAQQYAAMEPFQWGGERPFADGFPTKTRRARMVALTAPAPRSINPDFPLRLNTGRYRDQWHTMTRTALSPTLSQHRREALLEIHPDDAAQYKVQHNGLAELSSAYGKALYRVALHPGQRRGEVFAPMHWTDALAGGARTNCVAHPLVDPISGQPGFKDTPVMIAPAVPEWRAFLVARDPGDPGDMLYWSRSRVEGGWLVELAGLGAVPVDSLLPAGKRLEVSDATRGMRRIAVVDDAGRLLAALFVTRKGVLPPREWAAAQLGSNSASAVELLAARPSVPVPDRGPMVCICHGVGTCDILDAATAGAENVSAIGQTTRAGTNCGSCRPQIARLIEQVREEQREAAE